MFPGGSEWRRWDPHVHTPGTLREDGYVDWEEFLSALESQDVVRVIGVTDYLCLTNYSTLKKHKEEGRIPNIDLLIPNIEFRIAPPTDRETPINIHLLISPDDPEHERHIAEALARLSWSYNNQNYSCTPEQLMALGRAFDSTLTDDRAALSMGVLQFKIDFSDFKEWFQSEHWLQDTSLVAVSAGKDGLSGFNRDGGWAALREEITRFSDILFSGRPGEREFWLGEGSAEDRDMMTRLGGPKPCLHGSDAHELARLFRPDEDRFCWIKADPTFEGLRQVLYEPADRVHIGPTPPLFHDEARVIDSITLSKSDGWFDDTTIPLNPGLISIIGQKGSGKSALAEVSAFAAGSWETQDPASFLNRASDHLENLVVTLSWADGQSTEVRLGDGQPDDVDVRYLSQKFVERLCAEDHLGSELVKEIEAVVFAYLDPTETLNASSFDELRAIRTGGIRTKRNRLREDIDRLIREEHELLENLLTLPDKKKRVTSLTEERTGLSSQIPPPANDEEARLEEDLSQKRAALSELQKIIASEKQRIQKIADISAKVTAFQGQMDRFYAEVEALLKEADIPEAELSTFRPSFSGDTETPLEARLRILETSIDKKQGSADAPTENTVRWLKQQILLLEEQESADKALQQRVRTIRERISSIDSELERIQAEIKRIEESETDRRVAILEERVESYAAYFETLREEYDSLEQLYEPVKKRLGDPAGNPSEQELEFSIRWEADLETWLERGRPLFDQRRTLPYGSMKGLEDAAKRILMPAWTSGNVAAIRPAFELFYKGFTKKDLDHKDYLRTGVTFNDLLEWLYELDHINLVYGLKYNGVELAKLSPGTKGIVLLILYLGMDVDDTRPLIVDQPDENLDNESVYALLTTYIGRAKKRRQIFLITHNPNLVVNADSEQVIVARCEKRENGLPRILYESGSLENTDPPDNGIREQVCRILEGGAEAFRKRERRYKLPKS